MRRFLPELIALSLLPFLLAQGKRTRRITPRLPEAGGPASGTAGIEHPGQPISLLTVGESPVAGVGVCSHDEAITGQLAKALAAHLNRPIAWQACGRNGVTARDALGQLVPQIPRKRVDIALVAFGVNDTTAFRPVARWRSDLLEILEAIDARCAPCTILLSGVPPIAHFPALPQPLRWVLGLKARALDVAACDLAARMPRTVYVPLALDTGDPTMMAADGYHPSANGCTAWGQLLADAAVSALDGKSTAA